MTLPWFYWMAGGFALGVLASVVVVLALARHAEARPYMPCDPPPPDEAA